MIDFRDLMERNRNYDQESVKKVQMIFVFPIMDDCKRFTQDRLLNDYVMENKTDGEKSRSEAKYPAKSTSNVMGEKPCL